MSRSRQKKIRRFPIHIAAACCKQRRSAGGWAISFGEGRGREGRSQQQQQRWFLPLGNNNSIERSLLFSPSRSKRRRRGRGRREEEIALTASFFAAPKITLLPAVSLLPSASVEMGVLPLFCVSARTHAPRTWYGRKGSNVPFFKMGKGHSPRPFSLTAVTDGACTITPNGKIFWRG